MGHITISLVNLRQYAVIATVGREESLQFCRNEILAGVVINYRQDDFVHLFKVLSESHQLQEAECTLGEISIFL